MPLVTENDKQVLNVWGRFGQEFGGAFLQATPGPEQLAAYRALMLKVNDFFHPPGAKLAVVDTFEPQRDLGGGLTAAVAIPQGRGPFPVMVHAHGHGLVAGRPPEYEPWIRELARHGFTVVFPDFGWQPEIGFQDQVDQMLRAVDWAKRNAVSLKADPEKVVLSGDSMGAALALEVLWQSLANPAGPRFKAVAFVDAELAIPARQFGMNNAGLDRVAQLTAETPLPPIYFMMGSADRFGAHTLQAIGKLHSLGKPFAADFAYAMPFDFAKLPNMDAGRAANARMMQFLNAAV